MDHVLFSFSIILHMYYYMINYTFFDNETFIIGTIYHENMSIDTLFVMIPCNVIQILTKIGFSVMASII